MPPGSQLPYRRSIRIPKYDYAAANWFFVTICSNERRVLFGAIQDDLVRLSSLGRIVEKCWNAIPEHFEGVQTDSFVIMPNHVHGIIAVGQTEDTACRVPTSAEAFRKPVKGSLPTIVRSFKAAVTKAINEYRGTTSGAIWQGGYYERVIRHEKELARFRTYIEANPSRWPQDPENVVSR